MASRPEFFRPIDAVGTLRFETPGGQSLNLVADGENLCADLPSWGDAGTMLPRSFRGRRRAMHFMANVLATHGLTLSIESAGKPVVRLGHNIAPSFLARLLGLAPAYIPLSAILLTFRR